MLWGTAWLSLGGWSRLRSGGRRLRRGLGGLLARGALDDARTRGLRVLPYCPFIRGWIGKHPEYADLVPEASRARFGL
ncbi:hypothetical protein GCM10018966_049670 [Streptomyces yanii]